MPENLIGTQEACDLLGVDKSTVSRWVAAGRLVPLGSIGRAFVFDRAAVEALRDELAAAGR